MDDELNIDPRETDDYFDKNDMARAMNFLDLSKQLIALGFRDHALIDRLRQHTVGATDDKFEIDYLEREKRTTLKTRFQYHQSPNGDYILENYTTALSDKSNQISRFSKLMLKRRMPYQPYSLSVIKIRLKGIFIR